MDIVDENVRLVQLFLSNGSAAGVCEVSVNKKTKSLLCTCPGYEGRGTCKHVRFVKSRVDENGGTYPLELSTSVSEDEILEAHKSSNTFREFVIRHGVIEVL